MDRWPRVTMAAACPGSMLCTSRGPRPAGPHPAPHPYASSSLLPRALASAPSSPSVDPKEAAKFAALAGSWWDKQSGPFAALHDMNPTRLKFIEDCFWARQQQQAAGGRLVSALSAAAWAGGRPAGSMPLLDVEVLDVGCGGGLLSETLAKAGAKVGAAPGDGGSWRCATGPAPAPGATRPRSAVTCSRPLPPGSRARLLRAAWAPCPRPGGPPPCAAPAAAAAARRGGMLPALPGRGPGAPAAGRRAAAPRRSTAAAAAACPPTHPASSAGARPRPRAAPVPRAPKPPRRHAPRAPRR
jgi:hypothetical protein